MYKKHFFLLKHYRKQAVMHSEVSADVLNRLKFFIIFDQSPPPTPHRDTQFI
jgi:hypothetical protein